MLKVAIQSGGWYDHEKALESFEYIKECGFEAVDYNINKYIPDTWKVAREGIIESIFDKSVEELRDFFKPLKEASEKTGVSICQMHAPFPTWFNERDEINEYFASVIDKCLAVCEYVGCPALVIHPIARSTIEKERASNLAMFRTYIPIIKKYSGIKICIENIFDRMPSKRIISGRLSNMHEAVELVDTLNGEAGGDYFGFCLDVGHALATSTNVKEYIKALGHRLTVLHIHENNGQEDAHLIPYTCLDGTSRTVCDWDGFVEGLREVGYKGTICFESFRFFLVFPKETHTAALKLISAIGHTWASWLDKDPENE